MIKFILKSKTGVYVQKSNMTKNWHENKTQTHIVNMNIHCLSVHTLDMNSTWQQLECTRNIFNPLTIFKMCIKTKHTRAKTTKKTCLHASSLHKHDLTFIISLRGLFSCLNLSTSIVFWNLNSAAKLVGPVDHMSLPVKYNCNTHLWGSRSFHDGSIPQVNSVPWRLTQCSLDLYKSLFQMTFLSIHAATFAQWRLQLKAKAKNFLCVTPQLWGKSQSKQDHCHGQLKTDAKLD